jgi:O-methyltransferase domain
MILHDWGEAKNREILRTCHAALPSGGAVIVNELLVNDGKTGPVPAALMSLNMLVETEGRNYAPAEYGAWLHELGFQDIQTAWFCVVPGCRGAFSREQEDALWQQVFMAQPARRRVFEPSSKGRKRRAASSPPATG